MIRYLEDGDPLVIKNANARAYRQPDSGVIDYEITQLADAEVFYRDEERDGLYPVQYDTEGSPKSNDNYGQPYVEIPSNR